MKKLICILVIAILVVACDNKKTPISPERGNAKMINTSGVDIEIRNFDVDEDGFAERVFLRNGDSYTWTIKEGAISPLSHKGIGRAAVLFGYYALEYGSDKAKDVIDPCWFENYESTEKDGKVFYQYTFTKEKYQIIVDRYKKEPVNYKCVMVNKSGVKVVLEVDVKDQRVQFPKKLELLPDATFEWGFTTTKTSIAPPVEVPFGNQPVSTVKITYDDKIEVVYDSFYDKDPRSIDDYVRVVVDEENETYTYTFTEEDYQKAQQ